MKINWDRWINRDRGHLLLAGYTLCIAGLIFVYLWFIQPKPHNSNDFELISGQLQNVNFIEGSRGYRDYTFTLNNHINSFQIGADFIKYSNISNFKKLNEGDSLTIGILKTDTDKLNSTNKPLSVYFIKNKTSTFLDSKDTIAFQNSNKQYFYASGILFLGLIFLYFGYTSKIKTKIF